MRRQASRIRALGVSLVAATAVACGKPAPSPPPRGPVTPPAVRPNIVLVSIDSLRADHLGCYGYAKATSPGIDRLAAEGVRFANAIATSSWTLP